jgi:uncharacterized RDD family membrane protein YckC
MAHNYCQNCNAKLLLTLKMCPSCGSKNIDSQLKISKNLFQHGTIKAISSTSSTSNITPTIYVGQTFKLLPAPLGSRVLAFIVDTIIVSMLASLMMLFSYLMTISVRENTVNPLAVIGVLGSFIAPYIYYTLMHAAPFGATFGKKWLGIRVVNLSGEMLTKMQAFMRIIVTLLFPIVGGVAVALSLGGMAISYKEIIQESIIIAMVLAFPLIILGPYFFIFFNPLRQSLFDILMKTIVIKG